MSSVSSTQTLEAGELCISMLISHYVHVCARFCIYACVCECKRVQLRVAFFFFFFCDNIFSSMFIVIHKSVFFMNIDISVQICKIL